MRTREDLAWAAGLFEGEGCFATCQHVGGVLSIQASIQMTDMDVLQRFHNVVGIGIFRGPYVAKGLTKSGQPRKPSWIWTATSFENVQATIAMFWPWLGVRRRAKVKEILNAFHHRVVEKRGAHFSATKGLPWSAARRLAQQSRKQPNVTHVN